MSRALYHLSYGTADLTVGVPTKSRRSLGFREEVELSERLESAPSACASSSGAYRWRRAFSYSWPRAQVGWGAWDQDGCGAWIRTKDFRVMSPTSCRCSTPRGKVYRALSGPSARRTATGKAPAMGSPA